MTFDEVTQLLKEAGDRAWALLGDATGELWDYINQAEKAPSTDIRKMFIQEALESLEYFKQFLYTKDYDYMKERLDKSEEFTK